MDAYASWSQRVSLVLYFGCFHRGWRHRRPRRRPRNYCRYLARENPAAPLADEAITTELKKRGIKIARRTVAKYREGLGQPPAHLRKKRL
ncbi:MAG: hypothetical protein EBQ49_07210 [Verrucomicrobia bacterium]|nr:hypothetical protein [Verrucomicrobiota bacterium]